MLWRSHFSTFEHCLSSVCEYSGSTGSLDFLIAQSYCAFIFLLRLWGRYLRHWCFVSLDISVRYAQNQTKKKGLCLHTFISFIISFECLNKHFFCLLDSFSKKSCLYLYYNTVRITIASTDATVNRALATWQCLYTNSSLELCAELYLSHTKTMVV